MSPQTSIRSLFFAIVGCLCLTFATAADEQPFVRSATNVSDIIRSSAVDIYERRTFRIEGVAVAVLRFQHFILEDATGSVHCIICGEDLPVPQAGDRVVASGIFYRDIFQQSQLLSVLDLKIMAHTTPPAPLQVSVAEILSGQHENRRVIAEGQIIDAVRDAADCRWSYLVLSQGDKSVFVSVPDSGDTPFDPDRLFHEQVRVVGTVLTGHCGSRRFVGTHLETMGEDDLQVISPERDIFDAPPIDPQTSQTPSEIKQLGLRTLDGVVIAVWENHVLLVKRTPNEGHIIFQADLRSGQRRPAYGEHILVAGRPTTNLLDIRFPKAAWKSLSPKREPIRRPLFDVAEVLTRPQNTGIKGHGSTLVTTGMVALAPSASDPNRAILESGDIRIRYDISSVPELSGRLQQGARVKAVGCGVLEVDNWHDDAPIPKFCGFSFVARTPDDLTVLARPPWWTPARLASVILGLVALLVAIFVWNRMLNRLAERRGRQLHREGLARTSAELKTKERTRLAVELHDSLSQTLTGIAWHIDTANRAHEKAPDQTERHLVFARQALESCRADLRNCIWDLRNQTLEDADAATAVRRTVQPHVGNAEVTVDFGIPRRKMSDSAFHEILCVLRELATNAVRHGKARHIAITGTLTGDALSITVADDGCGFDPERRPGSAEGHFGLLGVSERLDRLNAALTVDSAPGRGATFTFTMRTDT